MGTRGVMGFRLEGKDHLQYNQFDMCPEGMGTTFIEFIKTRVSLGDLWDVTLRRQVSELIPVNGKKKPTAAQKKALKPYTDLRVSSQSADDWYCLLRQTQG